MSEQNIRDELRKISSVMDNFSLETVKIAKIQADLCEVKKENTGLKEKVNCLELEITDLKGENATLRSEVNTLKDEVKTLSGENAVLRGLNKTVLDKASKLDQQNIVLQSNVDTLRSDVDLLKSTFMPKVEESSNEQESNCSAESVEPTDAEASSVDSENIGKKTKAKKTKKEEEQIETFRNWGKVMTQRKKAEEFWASGLIKYTLEEWEDTEQMNGEQILEFIKTNVDKLTAFISSEESKQRFFLTFIKLCSMREVSKSKFQEIMQCFEGRGSLPNQITEPEIRKFTDLYMAYKV